MGQEAGGGTIQKGPETAASVNESSQLSRKALGHRYCNFASWVNLMALRSFDSDTRLGIPRVPSRSLSSPHLSEQFADEGTLILEPAPISVAPPSSMRPMTYSVPPPSSVRPPMPSWDDRSGWAPETANESTKSTRLAPNRQVSARERSASAMLLIATAAMLAALASIGFMNKAERRIDNDGATATAAAAQPVTVESNASAIPAPLAAPIAPPVQPIDIDEERPATAPAPKAAAPIAAPVAAPVVAAQPKPAKEAKDAKEKAPSQTAQQKALEDLLEQLGEEQLKR